MSSPQPPSRPGPDTLPTPVGLQYAWYPAPSTRENWPIILIIVIVVIVLLPVVLGAVFFGIGSGFMGPTNGFPAFFLGPVDQSNGNASVLIFAVEPLNPNILRFNLTANGSDSSIMTFPRPDGFAAVVVAAHPLRLHWFDPNHDGLLGTDDVLWITGDRAPLPAATTFRFTLRTADGSAQESVTWTTGPT